MAEVDVKPVGLEVHEYVNPDTAVSPMEPPLIFVKQFLVKSPPALAVTGALFTVTVTEAVLLQVLLVLVLVTV